MIIVKTVLCALALAGVSDAVASVHAPAYFWMWNDRLVPSKLCAQLDEMKANGIDGVCIHPFPKSFRSSIQTQMEPDYLTPDYLDVFAQVIRHAEKLGMHAYLYDEGGWPSGGACGQVAASDPEGRFCRRTMQLDEKGNPKVVVTPYSGTAPRTSIIEKGMTERFLQFTHERYAGVLGGQLGKTVKIAFTDEPDMPRSVPGKCLGWCSDFAEVFRAKKGYDILPHVPDLIRRSAETDDALAKVRIDYHDVMADLIVERYLKPLRGWCRAHGMWSGGHFNREDETAATPECGFGSLLRSLRALDAPGVDVIWRQLFPGADGRPATTKPFPRFAASAAHVGGNAVALSETFGIFGDSLSPEEMRWVVDYQLVRGINAFVFAYYAVSYAGQWMYQFEPHNGPVAPGWPMQRPFFAYVRRMSERLSRGKPGADIAVLYDVRGLWAGGADQASAAKAFAAVSASLDAMNCDYDYVDDDMLASARVLSDGRVQLGEMSYRSLVLPTSKWMTPKAKSVCEAFVRAGGRVVGEDGLASLPRTLNVSGAGASDLRVMKRVEGARTVYAVMNESARAVTCKLHLDEPGRVVRYRPDSDDYVRTSAAGTFAHSFRPGELAVFVVGDVPDCACETAYGEDPLEVSSGWTLRKVASHAVGKDDFIIRSCDEPERPVRLGDWRAELGERFSGRAVYRATFACGRSGRARLDLGKVGWCASVRLNGRDLGPRFSGPYQWEVDVRKGANELEVTVANLLVNQVGHDDVRDRLARDFPPKSYYDAWQRVFDRDNHASGLFGPVEVSFPGK